MLVAETVYEKFIDALVARATDTRYRPPEYSAADYGPLNSLAHLQKVSGFLERLPEHAQVRLGGKADQSCGGYFFTPTVATGVRQDDEIVQEDRNL